MTDKELRKAKKSELIEILYFLRKELDEARAENRELKEILYERAGCAVRKEEAVPEEGSGGERQQEKEKI